MEPKFLLLDEPSSLTCFKLVCWSVAMLVLIMILLWYVQHIHSSQSFDRKHLKTFKYNGDPGNPKSCLSCHKNETQTSRSNYLCEHEGDPAGKYLNYFDVGCGKYM